MSDLNSESYAAIRSAVEALSPRWAEQITWAQNVKRPASPEDMASELIFVICNSGMKHTVARQIFDRVMNNALWIDKPVYPATFKHVGKSAAIEKIWHERERLFAELLTLTDAQMIEWCSNIPWIGGITKYHAAKNLGADVAKPDRWLERIARGNHETVDSLCCRLARDTGDRIATVDLVLWAAAANGIPVPGLAP